MNAFTHSINRRRFLQLAVWLGAAGISVTVPALVKSSTDTSSDLIARKLTCSLKNKKSANIIGQEYLRIYPEEASSDLLVQLLYRGQSDSLTGPADEDSEALRRLLLAQQRDDFASGRTVNLKGWILAETEARLCALTTFL